MRRATAWAALCALAAACGDERAVYVDLRTEVEADRLCVTAFGAGRLVFSRAYTGGDAGGGTLSFLAGSDVGDEVRIAATASRGGAEVARASAAIAFGDGVREVPLHPARCQQRERRLGAPAFEMIGMVDTGATRIVAADLDGDGREELVVTTGTGTLLGLDVDDGGAVTTLGTDASGAAVAAGDLDGDCAADVVIAGGGAAASVVLAAGGEPRVEVLGRDVAQAVAIGDVGGAGVAGVAVAGPSGVAAVPFGGGAPVTLRGEAAEAVIVADLTGDGRGDVVAAGAGGASAWVAFESGLRDTPGTLPSSFAAVIGPLGAGDVDGDGAIDVIGATGMELRVGRNRGDGLLEERTGAMPPVFAAAIAQIVVADVDGDCRDDVTVIAMDGSVAVLRGAPGAALDRVDPSAPSAAGATAADLDGDGARELVLLGRAGEVSAWTE